MQRFLLVVAAAQAVYFVVTGIWPLVSIRTFMRITGPKTDLWLVQTVGMLITVVGAVIALGAWRGNLGAEVAALAIGSSAALALVDVVFVARRTIAPIYLMDAAAEAGLIALWTIGLLSLA